jgi:hypothetical protein
VSLALLIAAIIVFILAVLEVSAGVPLVPLGLALFAAAHLPLGDIVRRP